jgi:hypothetical protein
MSNHVFMKRAVGITAMALWAVITCSGNTITHSASIALQDTNWRDSVTIPKFDPVLGTLTKVIYRLDGHVEGDARGESLDALPADVSMNLSASISLRRPDLSIIVQVLPIVNETFRASSFDGTIDFAGTSGRAFLGLVNDASDTASSPPLLLSDLALFTGVGTITLPVHADGMSRGSGAGNLITRFGTRASARVTVQYEYQPASVPEGGTTLLTLAVGLLSLGGMRRYWR